MCGTNEKIWLVNSFLALVGFNTEVILCVSWHRHVWILWHTWLLCQLL